MARIVTDDSQSAGTSEAGETIATEATPIQLQTSRRRRLGYVMTPGRREERSYPLTERQIKNLAQGGLVVTLFLSMSGFLAGLGIDIHKDLDLAADLKDTVKATWTAYRASAFIGAGLLFVIAMMLAASGFSQIEEIKAQTTHDDDLPAYVRKRFPSVAIYGLLLVIFFVVGFYARPYLF